MSAPRNVLLEIAEMFDAMPHRDPSLEVGLDMTCGREGKSHTKHPCGKAMCIGAWVQEIVPATRTLPHVDAVKKVAPQMSWTCIDKLCVRGWGVRSRTTPQQAAAAIRNALVCNDPKWLEVLA